MKKIKKIIILLILLNFSINLYAEPINDALRSDFSKQEIIKIRFEVNKRLFSMNAGKYRIENVGKNRDKIRRITDKIVPWAIMEELSPPEIARIIVYMYHADEAGVPFDNAEDLIPIVIMQDIPLKDFVLMARCNTELKMAGIRDYLKDAFIGFAHSRGWDGISILAGGRGLILAKAAGLDVNKTASLLFKRLPAKGAKIDPERLVSIIYQIIGKSIDKKKTGNIVNNIKTSQKTVVSSEDSGKGLREINAVSSEPDKNISAIGRINQADKTVRNTRIDKEPGIVYIPEKTNVRKKSWRSLNRNEFYEVIRKWLGTPYRYGNSTGKPGIDCSGFVMRVMTHENISVPYNVLGRSSREQSKSGKYVARNDLRAGDLVFFSASPGRKKITHVGLVTSKGYFVHASSKRGVVNDDLNKKWWRRRYVTSRRIFSEVLK